MRIKPIVKRELRSLFFLHLLLSILKILSKYQASSVKHRSFMAQLMVISRILGKISDSIYFYKCYLISLFLSSICVYFSGFMQRCHIVSPNKGIVPKSNFTIISANLSLVPSHFRLLISSWDGLYPSNHKPNKSFLP